MYERSPEFRQGLRDKQRETHAGRTISDATRAKLSAIGKGRPKSEEWKESMRGEGNGRHSHGMTRTPTWRTWCAMRTRCFNPNATNFDRYGGRGITVCDRWLSFANFLADMGERPAGLTLDRINPDGNYEPGNCRWATFAEQRRNQRSRA